MLEIFEVGPCKSSYEMGFLIGCRFSNLIKSRLVNDLVLQTQLLPYAHSLNSQTLIASLSENNKRKYPKYWDELRGTADGSGVPHLHILLLNFRKEILPFVSDTGMNPEHVETIDDCSDVLVVDVSMAVAAHNEDATWALVGHTYLIRATLENGHCFTAYTYAGELPSCAFGFNSEGQAFTLNSVPPSQVEIEAGSIARNFISRDLLEATSINDALHRIRSAGASVGHCYNLIDIKTRKILNVELASRNRYSVVEIGASPFFHANMYLHLQVQQVQVHDENSIRRQERAALLPKTSKADILSLLGDENDQKYPIYMSGSTLHTLCTAMIDLDRQTLSIFEGNPGKTQASLVLSMSTKHVTGKTATSRSDPSRVNIGFWDMTPHKQQQQSRQRE
uniref:Peptidase C45 hydrolase domain-containing protein n=1 Tax=Kalanchoe fedtschenkoi TaxID=63787 RepID=A0A7N0SVB1_KALFE